MRDDDGADDGVPAVTTEPPTRHLCLGCRLVQAATGQCAQCGGTTVAPIELVRELLSYRDLSLAAERDLGMITGLVAAGTFVFPILWPVAVASLGALIVRVPVRHLRDRARLADPVAAIAVPPPYPPLGAALRRGVIRPFRGASLRSLWDDAPVLAEEIVIGAAPGGVLLRHARAVPFLIELDGDDRILVRGAIRLGAVAAWSVGDRKVRTGDALLRALDLPADLRLRGVAHRVRIAAGMRVTIAIVAGRIEDEAIAEHAALRDGGMTRVWHGGPGEPVLVADAFGAEPA
jgi:hypothetical protein